MKVQRFRTSFALCLGLAAIAAGGVITVNARAHGDGAHGCCPAPQAKVAGLG